MRYFLLLLDSLVALLQETGAKGEGLPALRSWARHRSNVARCVYQWRMLLSSRSFHRKTAGRVENSRETVHFIKKLSASGRQPPLIDRLRPPPRALAPALSCAEARAGQPTSAPPPPPTAVDCADAPAVTPPDQPPSQPASRRRRSRRAARPDRLQFKPRTRRRSSQAAPTSHLPSRRAKSSNQREPASTWSTDLTSSTSSVNSSNSTNE